VSQIVLVAGAWIGGWAFQQTARALRARGHDVYPLTLTGLGERSHLARAEVDLDTHIADVVNLLEYEDLRRAVLVGHSYAGIVVTGVADQAGDRLSALVYLDSAPMQNGQSHIDFYPPDVAEGMRRQVREQGAGWRLPFPGVERLGPPPMMEGLDAETSALLGARAVAQPFGSYIQPLRLHAKDGGYQRAVIACNGFREIAAAQPQMASFLTREWRRYDLPTGHWPMLSAPEPLAELLDQASGDVATKS
jgi:pimeloyl-ACP methyl ester carboxylesterase